MNVSFFLVVASRSDSWIVDAGSTSLLIEKSIIKRCIYSSFDFCFFFSFLSPSHRFLQIFGFRTENQSPINFLQSRFLPRFQAFFFFSFFFTPFFGILHNHFFFSFSSSHSNSRRHQRRRLQTVRESPAIDSQFYFIPPPLFLPFFCRPSHAICIIIFSLNCSAYSFLCGSLSLSFSLFVIINDKCRCCCLSFYWKKYGRNTASRWTEKWLENSRQSPLEQKKIYRNGKKIDWLAAFRFTDSGQMILC